MAGIGGELAQFVVPPSLGQNRAFEAFQNDLLVTKNAQFLDSNHEDCLLRFQSNDIRRCL